MTIRSYLKLEHGMRVSIHKDVPTTVLNTSAKSTSHNKQATWPYDSARRICVPPVTHAR